MLTPTFDPVALAQRFRPLYRLHSEEMWYPCHPEDQLRCANLVSTKDGSIVIPALGEAKGSPADQLLCTPIGLQQLADRGVKLDAATVAALQWSATSSPHYGCLSPSSGFVIQRADEAFMPPYGWIESTHFQPPNATWFHRGAMNNPLTWLGGDPSTYAPGIVTPPPTASRGAWQEPTTVAWVQRHEVAGVRYVDIVYTVMLAWNGSISLIAGQGEHPNDVETIVVRLAATDLDHPVRYMFQQHGGFCWYEPAEVELDSAHDGRLVVYLARESHECYPHAGRYMRLFGAADDVCDEAGVTWDAPVQYVNRPQGIDDHGLDVDKLRCSIAPTNPSSIVLVPLADPGPLWQYVRFSFLARRPPDTALTDNDFIHQPFPLNTTKWWPGEGPAGSTPPLSAIAADPNVIGIPPDFFKNGAPYLGPNPLPTCSGSETAILPLRAQRFTAATAPLAAYVATPVETVTGSDIGGSAATLAPNAPFVDWRGGIGKYLLGSIDAHMPEWVKSIADPLILENIVVGTTTIHALVVSGLRGITVAPAAATSACDVALSASGGPMTCVAIVSFAGGPQNVPMSAVVSSVGLDAVVRLVTPVAIPATDPTQWYVPYVGPLPYSYATQPFATTTMIASATFSSLTITVGTITVDVGNNLVEDLLIDLLLAVFTQALEQHASSALQDDLNALLISYWAGRKRF